MPSLLKKPGERFKITGDFSSVLVGETLDGAECEVTAVDRDDNDVTSTIIVTDSITIVGGKISARIQSGSSEEAPYIITITAVTTDDSCWQLDVILNIDE